MQLEGEITRITFHNELNGYTIATLSHNREHTTVVGRFFSIKPGENVKLQGEFVTNKTYGEQFSFSSYEIVYPSTTKVIKHFLGSGLIKGVGVVTASAIVEKFGKESLEVIEYNPLELTKIRGISPKKAMSIQECFMEYKDVQNIIVFLSEYGITVNMALKIYEIYKRDTIRQVQENPYALVEEVDGIGFLTADKIANKFGIDKNSKFRIRAGTLYTLNQASERNGHTFLPYEELLKKLSSLLGITEDDLTQPFDDILATLSIEGQIVETNKRGVAIVALKKLYNQEKNVAKKLSYLNHNSFENAEDFSKDIELFEKINNIKFHSEQVNAIKTALSSGVCVITGGPGTGKTTIIKCILTILDQQKIKTLLLAPTGRASKRMSDATGREASTIHRALSVDFITKKFYYNEKNPLAQDAIIIDEFSMVDISLASYLFSAIKRDAKVIMVGDKDQLPSVGAGNVLDDILKSGAIKVAELTQIFRQDENSLIISNAHKINAGEMPDFDNSSKDFFFENKMENTEIAESIVSLVSERLPKFLKLPPTSIQVLSPLKNGVCGVENINKLLQETLNPPRLNKSELLVGSATLREGDKIMQTMNNYNLEWEQRTDYEVVSGTGVFNGDMGFITSINRSSGEVSVMFENNKVCVYPRSDINQLSLAYAITIHKSQGSEFDAVVIPSITGPSIILNRNLIYTAVTRAKKVVVLVGQKKNLKTMINNKFILHRNTLLRDFLIDAHNATKTLFE